DVIRATRVYGTPTPLALAEESLDDVAVTGLEIELDGLRPDLVPGRWVVVCGERVDLPVEAPGAELAMIAAVEQRVATIGEYAGAGTGAGSPAPERGDATTADRGLPGDSVHTFLRLSAPLEYAYRRSSVVIYGNVARATDGATKAEVL